MSSVLKNYIGVKMVLADPMTIARYREWQAANLDVRSGIIKSDVDHDEGYRVVYPDGYVSWCPKDEFEKANRRTDGMTFGHAIEAARKGHKIGRKAMHGQRRFIVYMPPFHLAPYNDQDAKRKVNDRTAEFVGKDQELDCLGYFAMCSFNDWQPGWIPTQRDMLADDWMVIE